jgi:hypothetical protein
MVAERVPITCATVFVSTVANSRQETTESRTSPVALPSEVLVSTNTQAGSSAMVRFFVTSATTTVLTAPA